MRGKREGEWGVNFNYHSSFRQSFTTYAFPWKRFPYHSTIIGPLHQLPTCLGKYSRTYRSRNLGATVNMT